MVHLLITNTKLYRGPLTTFAMMAFAIFQSLSAFAAVQTLPYAELHLINDPTPRGSDGFGNAIAIDGDRLLVGARTDETLGDNVGQAILFSAYSGAPLSTFNDPTLAFDFRGEVIGGDLFGSSVSVDGNHILIGAPGDRTLGNGVGQAHLFRASDGGLIHTFNDPTVTNSDNFGRSVQIDNNYAIIGAPFDDTKGLDVGQVHVFDLGTGALSRTIDDPTVTGQDWFGYSIATHGTVALIGDPRDNTNGADNGQAHLFNTSTGELLYTLRNPTSSSSEFGWSVAVDQEYVLVGAPRDTTDGVDAGLAHLFDRSTGELLRTFSAPSSSSRFGWSVAISDNVALIGSLGPSPGLVYAFDALTGNLLQVFADPTDTSGDGFSDDFGFSVAANSRFVAIGAPRDDTMAFSVGQAHVYVKVPEPPPYFSAWAALYVGLAVLRHARRATPQPRPWLR